MQNQWKLRLFRNSDLGTIQFNCRKVRLIVSSIRRTEAGTYNDLMRDSVIDSTAQHISVWLCNHFEQVPPLVQHPISAHTHTLITEYIDILRGHSRPLFDHTHKIKLINSIMVSNALINEFFRMCAVQHETAGEPMQPNQYVWVIQRARSLRWMKNQIGSIWHVCVPWHSHEFGGVCVSEPGAWRAPFVLRNLFQFSGKS